MHADIVAIGVAYLFGVLARIIGLPPLVGYLAAGFTLHALGGRITPVLHEFSEMGVTLLLFSIGLKLRLRSLLMPQIWGVASLHMALAVGLAMLLLSVVGSLGLPLFSALDGRQIAVLAFALSFSSTVFAVKVLEEKGEMNALYGRIAIGILIVQDIAAVVFLGASTGKLPSIWALSLLLLLPARPLLYRLLEQSGRGELQILFGLMLALGGAQLFELVGVKGDLGALILGVLLAGNARAPELSHQLLGFKDLFLVGFFLSIGLSGPVSAEILVVALSLLLLVPLKTVLFFGLLSAFRLRARTALLATLSLANYSEFGLIVAAVAASAGWLGSEWLIAVAVAVALSFVLAAPLNSMSHGLYRRHRSLFTRFESPRRIEEESPIEAGDASVLIFGMGRVGSGAYDRIRERLGETVAGVDLDQETVERQLAAGRRVIHGSATDPDFWSRFRLQRGQLKLVLLALPHFRENITAAAQLKSLGYDGRIAAVAKYPDEVPVLEDAGVDAAYNLYAEAGAGFAEHVYRELLAGIEA
ncbi:MAG TPA: potassium transporter Kef [Gammaproteobacteria bacterium]|nr:potassium transporter Kef [Gammaproteobacteria bacterium]